MRVLLITFSFPPAGGVGVLRALSLAKYLPESGVEVEVLTARNAPAVRRDDSLASQVPLSVPVHRTWTLDLPFKLRKAIKRILSRKSNPRSTISAERPASKPSLLKGIVADILLPDPQIGWLPFAIPSAVKLIVRRKIDLVIITTPPFSCARIVPALRRRFPALPIVLEFRDEWLNTTIDLVSYNNRPRARQVALKTEAEGVRDATAVILVSKAAEHALKARYPNEPSAKFITIPNGFDREIKPWVETQSSGRDCIRLTFVGTVYGSSNPNSLVEAVSLLPPEVKNHLQIRFIGHIENPEFRTALVSLGNIVELIGVMPQAEALKTMEDTDYLLLISHDPINVAAKLYDYLAGGKPIVAFIRPDSDIRRILEETKTGRWADVQDVRSMRQLLLETLDKKNKKHLELTPQLDAITRYHRRVITQRYASLLLNLATNSSLRRDLA